jgi:hypothetical protein
MAQNEADQIIGQITDATVHLVNRNLDMVQRVTGMNATEQSSRSEGPAQEIWTAWTESAGDLVEITYLTARLADRLWGRAWPFSGGS